MLTGESPDDLSDRLQPDVVMWSPAAHSRSRDVALAEIAAVTSPAETLSELSLVTTGVDVVLPHVYLEWRLSGRVTGPCFVDDDLLLEPSGRLVELAGVLVTTITDGRVASAHCYYDDVALLEQMITDTLPL
jgi:hypothetical protein